MDLFGEQEAERWYRKRFGARGGGGGGGEGGRNGERDEGESKGARERGGENMPAGLLSGHITFSWADIAPARLNIDTRRSLFSAVNLGICLCFAYVVVFIDPAAAAADGRYLLV